MIISVIVRAYNDVGNIGSALMSAFSIGDEVIVVEGACKDLLSRNIPGYNSPRSVDGTRLEIARQIKGLRSRYRKYFVGTHRVRVRVIRNASKTDHSFNDSGFWEVSSVRAGDFVIVVDSDEGYCQDHAFSIRRFIKRNHGSLHNVSVPSINCVSKSVFRSDSGPICIGGRVTEKRVFETDRRACPGPVFMIPFVYCTHNSVNKPVEHLRYKLQLHPEISNHWVVDEATGKVVFVDGTELYKAY